MYRIHESQMQAYQLQITIKKYDSFMFLTLFEQQSF
jgi:hypothetical protein